LSGIYLMLTISQTLREKIKRKKAKRIGECEHWFLLLIFSLCTWKKKEKTLCLLINKWNLSVSWTTTHIHYEFEEGHGLHLETHIHTQYHQFQILIWNDKKKEEKEENN
jgi:hypothetical protein